MKPRLRARDAQHDLLGHWVARPPAPFVKATAARNAGAQYVQIPKATPPIAIVARYANGQRSNTEELVVQFNKTPRRQAMDPDGCNFFSLADNWLWFRRCAGGEDKGRAGQRQPIACSSHGCHRSLRLGFESDVGGNLIGGTSGRTQAVS